MTQRNWSQFKVGDYVLLTGKEGYIRYIGERTHHHGTWYGIELIIGNGRHSGSEYGKKYFPCKHKRGIFVQSSSIKCKLSKLIKQNNKKNTVKNHTNHKQKRKSKRTNSSLKAPKSSRKPPKQKHKMSRSISPMSRTQKNKTKSRATSKVNSIQIPRTTSIRSKSHANIGDKPPKPRPKRAKPKPPPKNKNKNKNKSKFKTTPYPQHVQRMRLTNSKSIPPEASHATLSSAKPLLQTPRLTIKAKSVSQSNSQHQFKKKKIKKKRQDYNIKPSAYIKHKKRRSGTYEKRIKLAKKKKKKGEKHNASRSVGNYDKKQTFDLEAILGDKLPICNKLKIRKAASFNLSDDKKKGRKYRTRDRIVSGSEDICSPRSVRSRSDNSLVFSVTNEVEEECEDKWECEKCYRMNVMEFNFCPICGVKRALYTVKKIEIALDLELKQGSDSDEMTESESDHSDRGVGDGLDKYRMYRMEEEKEMESILDDMKYENNVKMEKVQREREELKGLKKEDFIKTFDSMNVNVRNTKNRNSDSSADTPSPVFSSPRSPPTQNIISPKFKIKKPNAFSIKNWILSPKGSKSAKENDVKYETDTNYDNVMKNMGITNKYNNNNNNDNGNGNDNVNMVYNNGGYEESISYSDISYAYSVGRKDSDRLNNIKNPANYRSSLDLIPDTPRSIVSEFDTPKHNQNNHIKVYPYTFNKGDIENHKKNNSNDVGVPSDDKKRKRKKKPKNAKKKKRKKNSQNKFQIYYEDDENE